MPRPFRSDRDWTFEMGVEELWERLSSYECYSQWWPWLRRFDPDGGFADGACWACEVTPPLPYVVRFTVELDRVEPGRAASALVHGDVAGEAELTVQALSPSRSTARLRSRLAPSNPVLRGFGTVARPLVEWGHDWVLDQGRRQFVERVG